MDYTALANEINTDPTALGYAPHVAAGDDGAVATLLNQDRPTIQIEREFVESWEVNDAIVPSEYEALSVAKRSAVDRIISGGRVHVRGVNTRLAFSTAFGSATVSRANLVDLQTQAGSRAEQLFGANVTVTPTDVAIALGRTG